MNPVPETLYFNQKSGYFYDMVTTFSLAIAGLESIFGEQNLMGFKENQVMTLEGKVHKTF